MAVVRRPYDALRFTPQRLLHRSRHRKAIERLTSAGCPGEVLILCYGNICRSPYAEAKLLQLLAERGRGNVHVESAGFIGPDRQANESAQRAAAARGLDLSRHRSRIVEPEMAAGATLILVMTSEQAKAAVRGMGSHTAKIELLGDLDPERIRERDIPDPYGQPIAAFERVFNRIDRCLSTLVQAW